MYTFSSRLKTFSFILMVLGILGIGYSFFTAPRTVEDVEKILAADSHHGGDAHHGAADAHATGTTTKEATSNVEHTDEATDHAIHDDQDFREIDNKHVTSTPADEAQAGTTTVNDTSRITEIGQDVHDNAHTELGQDHAADAVSTHADDHEVHDAHAEHQEHLEHVLHQLQNKPWAAVYVAAIFFMLIALGALAFYAIQIAAQAGWSPVLFRVMEAISAYLLPGSIIFLLLLIAGTMDLHHLFIWMDEEVVKNDHLIQGKTGYLNDAFFLIRAIIFLGVWNLYRFFARRNSIAQDDANDNSYYKKNFKMAAGFLVFFIVSESIMSWDWIMSVDPHWYSTLFGWYVFASFIVSAVTVINLFAVYLKSRGYLEYVNTSHIHDLAKFMFGFSVFWTYLWFSQFMLIWYANIPEEVTYFVTRIEQYNLPFFGMVALNFILPILILINTDFKRLSWIIVMAGIIILCGHYLDFYLMIMPATVGDQWFIGVGEIASVLFFLGLFIFVVFTALTKVPLLAKRNPLIEESKHFHY